MKDFLGGKGELHFKVSTEPCLLQKHQGETYLVCLIECVDTALLLE